MSTVSRIWSWIWSRSRDRTEPREVARRRRRGQPGDLGGLLEVLAVGVRRELLGRQPALPAERDDARVDREQRTQQVDGALVVHEGAGVPLAVGVPGEERRPALLGRVGQRPVGCAAPGVGRRVGSQRGATPEHRSRAVGPLHPQPGPSGESRVSTSSLAWNRQASLPTARCRAASTTQDHHRSSASGRSSGSTGVIVRPTRLLLGDLGQRGVHEPLDGRPVVGVDGPAAQPGHEPVRRPLFATAPTSAGIGAARSRSAGSPSEVVPSTIVLVSSTGSRQTRSAPKEARRVAREHLLEAVGLRRVADVDGDGPAGREVVPDRVEELAGGQVEGDVGLAVGVDQDRVVLRVLGLQPGPGVGGVGGDRSARAGRRACGRPRSRRGRSRRRRSSRRGSSAPSRGPSYRPRCRGSPPASAGARRRRGAPACRPSSRRSATRPGGRPSAPPGPR